MAHTFAFSIHIMPKDITIRDWAGTLPKEFVNRLPVPAHPIARLTEIDKSDLVCLQL